MSMRMRNPKDKNIVLENCDFYYSEENQFLNDNEIHLEIGMGKGNFIIGMAKLNPNINYIGIERYEAAASIGIKKIDKEKLSNIKVIVDDVTNVIELLEGKIDKIYLNFSDPWPKDRHAKRRLTHERQLILYDKLFKDVKTIEMKTDNDDLFEISLKYFEDYGYDVIEKSYDLHSENKLNVMTEYEEKFTSEGILIKYVLVNKKY